MATMLETLEVTGDSHANNFEEVIILYYNGSEGKTSVEIIKSM